jgi:glycosyltransferase involved in cell wall biosynthesis
LRIEQIPLGLDLNIFRPNDREACRQAMNIQRDDRVVLFICQSLENRRKGLDLLLSAVEAIEPKSSLVLMSIGIGSLPQIGDIRCLNLGTIESDHLLSLVYNVADVFVIPSREENLALTALEATACGCPAVGFSIGGLPDIIEDGRTGYLAAPFEIRQLRDAIEAAIRCRDNLSPACRSRAEALFSLETQAQAYQRLYSDMLKPSLSKQIEIPKVQH